MQLLERCFGLARAGTTARREVVAGLTTFLTLSYILFVQPAVLSAPPCGMDAGGVLFATCVASAVACFLMAALTNYPIALAPAMGHNFYFAFVVCGSLGFTWNQALAANLLAGVTFLVLTPTGFRDSILRAVPASLRGAIATGIGLLIALVGLQWSELIVAHPVTYVALGDLREPVPLLALGGLTLTSVLLVRRVRGAVLVGMLGTAAAGWLATLLFGLEPALVTFRGLVGSPPSPSATALQLDFAGLFAQPAERWALVLATFLVLDLFDTVGTLLGVGTRAGLLRDGELPRARGAFTADAAGTTIGAALGTSTVTSYVESTAGVEAGGRTGLVPVVCGLAFLASLVFLPLVETVGSGVAVAPGVVRYPVVAPVLILIGALMTRCVTEVAWDDPVDAIPGFLTIVVMQLSLSISDGLAFGFVAHSVCSLAAGRRTSLLAHAIAAFFVARYAFL